jgi:hypothetical protein
MSVGTKLLQAAAGNAGEAVYVDDVFSCFLYEGNATSRSIVNGIDLADKGGLVWTKNRDDTYDHNFVDSARGLTNSPYIRSNTNGSQGTDGNGITVFNNNGYTVGTSGSWNANGNSHVSWTFAKQEKFFDIVTYTGDGTTSRTINHNLGSVPGMIMIKKTDSQSNWSVYHRGSPVNASGKKYNLKLNVDNAAGDSDFWPTTPTSTQFFLGDSDAGVNASGGTYVAYLFGHNEAEFGENSNEAIIKCGSVTASSPAFVENIGFEPQWLLVKKTSGSGVWQVIDNMRGSFVDTNGDYASRALYADTSDTESSENYSFGVANTGIGVEIADGATYVYVAIRRPNKPASEFAATDLFTPVANPGNSSEPYWTASHVIDTFWQKNTTSGGWYIGNRLTQGRELQFDSTAAEGGAGNHMFDYQTGVSAGASGTNAFRYLLRRAKGFFDIVAYTGTGSATTISHNLGVVPELIWIKGRSEADSWVIWDKNADLSTSTPLFSDFTQARRYNKLSVNATAPTASVFSIGSAGYSTNSNGATYITYLFASVDGISKVGTYTGTGGNVDVDCGFSAGARFVLIWRTDSSGPGWYVYDSVRGIVAGNDPYYLLGSNAAQVTNTDYIDPLNAGFTVTSSAPAALNNSGGTYAFLAIA